MTVAVERRTFDLAVGLTEFQRRVIALDPYRSGDDVVQLRGLVDETVAGGELMLPLELKVGAGICRAVAGADLWVDKAKRKSKLGLLLPDEMALVVEHGGAVCAATSQDALPVYEFLGYTIFLLPRYIALWKSRSVVEMKVGGFWGKILVVLADCGLALYAGLLWVLVKMALWRYRVVRVSEKDDALVHEVAAIIARDPARYAEVHDVRWLKWILSIREGGESLNELTVVKRAGQVVGFYVQRRRFYETASHRGFKNVWLGSLVEWQMIPEEAHKTGWVLALAALRMRRSGVDAVDVATAEPSLQRLFRFLLWQRVGESNFLFRAGAHSPLKEADGVEDLGNWRLRPGMADVCMGL